MAIRLHEIHPSVVHFPLTLVPAALMLDIFGRSTGNKVLMDAGRILMPVAAVSGVVAGLAGLAAQQAVRAEGRAHDLLTTHRNLNVALIGLTGMLAAVRMRQQRPGLLYMLLGIGGVGAMNYTAYLGGKMVYSQGVGVESARGVELQQAPEMRRGAFRMLMKMFVAHVLRGAGRAVREISHGEIAPMLQSHRLAGGLRGEWRATDPSVGPGDSTSQSRSWISRRKTQVTGSGTAPGQGGLGGGDPF